VRVDTVAAGLGKQLRAQGSAIFAELKSKKNALQCSKEFVKRNFERIESLYRFGKHIQRPKPDCRGREAGMNPCPDADLFRTISTF
jgi:hypothetical protein